MRRTRKVLLVHSQPLECLGGAELSLRAHIAAAPSGVTVDVILPDDPVDLKPYDTVIMSNLRPTGGLGEKEEYRRALEWVRRIKGYRGYVIKLEHDVHPCAYRDARCVNFDHIEETACDCDSPIPRAFEELYHLCDAIIFLSPLHRRVINRIIPINVRRQYDIATPIDFDRFRNLTPFDERKHAALITGDAPRVAPEAAALAEAAGYPVEEVEYLSVPYDQMPELLNQYQAVVVAPVMLHAFGRLVAEAMACGCRVITNNRVGAMSYPDPLAASRKSSDAFWAIVNRRPLWPNIHRVNPKDFFRRWRSRIGSYRQRMAELRKEKNISIQQERLIYRCSLNSSKRRNLALQTVNRSLLNHVELARPHILHVGVTTHCNLNCPACPSGTDSLGRKGEHLDFDVYRRTVDSLRGSLLFMLFWDWGEPFLHPKLPEMIAHARKSGIRTVISTNGNVTYSDQQVERLVRAQPDTVIVCVDGADQETYQTYRTGGQLEAVLQTTRRLAETKERLGQRRPLIEFRTLATKGTERQMPQLLQLAQESGADLFSVKTLRPYNYRDANVDGELVPENPALARYEYTEDKPDAAARKEFASTGPLDCGKPFYAPTLNSDGTLAFCSYAQQSIEFFGNLTNQVFSKVWKNRASRQQRIAFQAAGGTPSCRTCYFRSAPAPTIIHQVPLRPLPDGIEVDAPQTPEEFLNQFVLKKNENGASCD